MGSTAVLRGCAKRLQGDVPVIGRCVLAGCSGFARRPRAGSLRQQYDNERAEKNKRVSGYSPANPAYFGSSTWARTRDLRINSPNALIFACVDCQP